MPLNLIENATGISNRGVANTIVSTPRSGLKRYTCSKKGQKQPPIRFMPTPQNTEDRDLMPTLHVANSILLVFNKGIYFPVFNMGGISLHI